DGREVIQLVLVRLRRIVWVAVLVLPLTASAASRKTAPTRDAGEKEQLTGVSALLHRTFASVEEIDEWTAQYTKRCGCSKPVGLARGTKEVVVIICSRTSGPRTSDTFVFDKHKNGYRFMLLRHVLSTDL